MLRQSLLRTFKSTSRTVIPARRSISISAIRMGEGDAGAPRSGGSAQGDAFTKREQANEDYFVRQKEMEKLQALKDKIAGHQKHLEELDKHVTEQINSSKGDKK